MAKANRFLEITMHKDERDHIRKINKEARKERKKKKRVRRGDGKVIKK